MQCIISGCSHEQFENEDRCIFHCNKTIENGWKINSDDKHIKYNKKIKLFWEKFIDEYSNNSIFTNMVTDNFIIPFYHTDLVENNYLSDIRDLQSIRFINCIFIDDFIFKNNKKKLKSLSFNNCGFYGGFNLGKLNTKWLILLHCSFKKYFSIMSVQIDAGEFMDLKSLNNEPLNINIHNLDVKNKLEIWKCNDKNTYFNIEYSSFFELDIYEVNISALIFTFNNIFKFKFKIRKSKIKSLFLINTDFETDSKILFENLNCNNFKFDQLSQDSKYIQLNHIKILQSFDVKKVEFKNTYFNDVDLSKATKTIDKTSFVNSHLNSIEWGNISQIKTKRDIFRELKYIYDEQKSYIDANNFFSMEMKEYSKELKNKKFSIFWQEKLIFYINEKISNFSQSWFLPLLWIIIANLGFYTFMKISNNSFDFTKILLVMISFIFLFIITYAVHQVINEYQTKNINLYTMQHILIIILLIAIINFFNYGSIEDVMFFSNIQSYKDYIEISNCKNIFRIWMLHKIILGFLIYHFVIALRRQTKR